MRKNQNIITTKHYAKELHLDTTGRPKGNERSLARAPINLLFIFGHGKATEFHIYSITNNIVMMKKRPGR